ncbi:mirror-image polydactyly gene 1 protein-like [Lethenteron reissneri]|nr:mirror-image polydactyly gene 1 protein-like [Lethenteron reissneri]
MEARVAEKAAVLVDEILVAQRQRDEAMLSRVHTAEEEREAAVERARRLEKEQAEIFDYNCEQLDLAVEELLEGVREANSGRDIERYGAALVSRIRKGQARRDRITAEEMRAVVAERDDAIARCKTLDQELSHAKGELSARASSGQTNDPEQELKIALSTAQRERDAALKRCHKLQKELQQLHTYSSSFCSSASQGHARSAQGVEGTAANEAAAPPDPSSEAWRRSHSLSSRLEQALSERMGLEARLRRALSLKAESAAHADR